ncbi:hypothetical protein FMEAI12_2760012 [Parafrankia sp. Ea1.12]|nr:hypothetical protein FMEAI12_2760012 [Parafrankia sp. Ea1.12]
MAATRPVRVARHPALPEPTVTDPVADPARPCEGNGMLTMSRPGASHALPPTCPVNLTFLPADR